MRKIDKSEPLRDFIDFVRRNKPRDWDKDVPSDLKRNVREHILYVEQNQWSAYTERKLDNNDASLHVDHLVKQQYCKSGQQFEWTNLFVDEHAGIERYGADFKDNSKKRVVKSLDDCLKLINPAKEDPHDYFSYAVNGEIMAKFEGYERREAKILACLKEYGISSIDECKEICAKYSNGGSEIEFDAYVKFMLDRFRKDDSAESTREAFKAVCQEAGFITDAQLARFFAPEDVEYLKATLQPVEGGYAYGDWIDQVYALVLGK